MSRENVEVVRRVFDAWNRHDPGLLFGYLTEDVELDWSESIAPFGGFYRGQAEARGFYDGLIGAWSDVRWEPLELIELDSERLLSVNRVSGRGRHSGVEVSGGGAVIWTLRRGKVVRLKLFQSKQEALEAAGLSE